MGKKQKCPEFENHERWLVSYADMLTLLFAVFVVLYALSMAGTKQKQQDEIAGSIQESFNMPLEDIPLNRRATPKEGGFGIFEHMRGDQIRPPLTQKFPSERSSVKVIDDEMNKVKATLEERLYGGEKFRENKDAGLERIVTIHRNEKGFKVRLLARHFYDSGSIHIKRTAYSDLDKVINTIKSLGRPVTVEGHTDSLPPTNSDLTNWELSSMRAANITRYMIREHNFPTSLLSVAGFADTKPLAHNGTEAGRALNRRIEFQIHYDSQYDSDLPEPR